MSFDLLTISAIFIIAIEMWVVVYLYLHSIKKRR